MRLFVRRIVQTIVHTMNFIGPCVPTGRQLIAINTAVDFLYKKFYLLIEAFFRHYLWNFGKLCGNTHCAGAHRTGPLEHEGTWRRNTESTKKQKTTNFLLASTLFGVLDLRVYGRPHDQQTFWLLSLLTSPPTSSDCLVASGPRLGGRFYRLLHKRILTLQWKLHSVSTYAAVLWNHYSVHLLWNPLFRSPLWRACSPNDGSNEQQSKTSWMLWPLYNQRK